MGNDVIFYIYGMCTMFYAMMAWLFGTHGHDRLWRLVTLLMAVICAECIKDVCVLEGASYGTQWNWSVATAVDMVAVPIYGFILRELCTPGQLTWHRAIAEEAPFVILPTLLITTRNEVFYHIEVAWAAVYGLYYAVWTFLAIPKYHKHLKETFSYTENINLNWLHNILIIFICLIVLWTIDSFLINFEVESIYMISSMVAWMCICFFLYRHESVLTELDDVKGRVTGDENRGIQLDDIRDIDIRIEHLMLVKKAYLNPKLKLSDVASEIGSNRTYVSNWFNSGERSSFFDYVNQLRIDHACEQLKTTDDPMKTIAQNSGFNSIATFYRLFSKLKGMTPNEFRDLK